MSSKSTAKGTAAYKYGSDHAQSFAFDEERAQFIAIFAMVWVISCFVQCHVRMACLLVQVLLIDSIVYIKLLWGVFR